MQLYVMTVEIFDDAMQVVTLLLYEHDICKHHVWMYVCIVYYTRCSNNDNNSFETFVVLTFDKSFVLYVDFSVGSYPFLMGPLCALECGCFCSIKRTSKAEWIVDEKSIISLFERKPRSNYFIWSLLKMKISIHIIKSCIVSG